MRVVIVDGGYESYDAERAGLSAVGAEVVLRDGGRDAEAIAGAIADAAGVFVRETPIDATVLSRSPALRGVVRYGVGVDNIDLEAAAARGVKVANVPDYGVEEVSTHALALMLAVARRIAARDAAVRRGAWNIARARPMHRLAGGTLGLVGYGRIGSAFHAKASGLGFARTLVSDPGLAEAPAGAERVELARLIGEADVIALFAPLTARTRHLLDRPLLALAKPTAILVNTSRGGLVDEDALAAAIAEGRLFGAGLDVFEREPPDLSHPLFALEGVVVSDHTAWYSEASVRDLQRKATEEMIRILRGEDPVNWVNRPRAAA